MKILFLAPQPFFAPRGTPIAVRAALEALSELGHVVDVLTYFAGEDVAIPGVTIHRIRRPPLVRHLPIGPSWQKIPCNLYMVRKAYEMLSARHYDVVHAVEEAAILAWLISRRTGHAYVFDMDSHMSAQLADKSPLLRPFAWIFARLEAAALAASAGVLAVCPALVEVAGKHQSPEKVALLPDMPLNDGGPTEPSEEIRRLGGLRIVYVGNLESYQGIGLLIAAFRRLAPDHPEARLVIVGGSDRDIARHSESVRELVAAGRINFLGPRPLSELGEILAAADILVSPRLQGVNTPMKIYSYLESGRPVVATRLPTHTQVIREDVACLVAPTEEGIVEGLSKLLGDPSLRARLGARGQEFVRAEYGRERFRRRLAEFYGALARHSGGDAG